MKEEGLEILFLFMPVEMVDRGSVSHLHYEGWHSGDQAFDLLAE